jgi:FkbM family methyltransferase
MNLPPGIIRTPEGHYVLAQDSHISRWVEEQKRLNIAEEQIAFYAEFIKPGAVVLDAGACIGDHTATYARLVGETGRVFALEPNPLSFDALRLNFAGILQVSTFNIGLSDVSEVAKMHPEYNVGASFVSDEGNIPVTLVTIDSQGFDRLDFIHLDCEGLEINVLRGGENIIARCRPAIVLEVSGPCLQRAGHTVDELMALLDALGYDWREIEPHHGPHLPQRDIIAFPRK